MPRLAHKLPSYRLHRSDGRAVVTIAGRDIYLGPYNSPESRAEYERCIAEWLTARRARPRSESAPAGGDATVGELMLGYIRHADAYYVKDGAPTSEPTMIRLSLRVLKQLYGHSLAKDFGPLALKAVRQRYVDGALCRTEVNRRTRHVVRFFRWAVENELVSATVYHALKAVTGLRKGRCEARESKPVRPVPEAFVDAIRPHVSRQVWAMIELQRLTGMRPGEVSIMRTVDLETSGRAWEYVPGRHKTEHHERERRIYLGPRAQEVLRPWLRTDLATHLFSPAEAEAERLAAKRSRRKTPVQPSQRDRRKPVKARPFGDAYTVRAYHTAIARGCRKAGVPPWGPNRLRHNAATRLRREYGLDVARAILGHSSPAVTEIYAELDREKARDVMSESG
jgi:integrase